MMKPKPYLALVASTTAQYVQPMPYIIRNVLNIEGSDAGEQDFFDCLPTGHSDCLARIHQILRYVVKAKQDRRQQVDKRRNK